MNITRKLYKHKDNVSAQLNAGISAATLSIPLKSGHGASFPTTYSGTATSLGSSTTLNATGIGSSGIAVGDLICNITDGSIAVVKAVNTNALTTTRLKGGTNNTWANSDKYVVNPFVITLIQYDTDGTTILKREKVLIDSRSTDNLTVNASGRGFDGSTAQSFSADDHVYLFWTSAATDGMDQVLSQLIQDVDNLVSQGSGEVYAADGGGSDAYSITLVPAPSGYATGQVFNFKANTANTGAASLNVNGLGAKTIKKNHDQDLEDNDIESGQIVTVVYDGTNFEMQSQVANVFTSKANVQNGDLIYAADAVGTDAYAITLSPAPVAYATGMMVHFKAGTVNTGAATLNVNGLGAKTIKKNVSVDLDDGDIAANQIVSVIYDGTNFQLLSRPNTGVTILSKGTTAVTFTNSTAENTLLSVSIPANTLGSTGGIRLKVWLSDLSISTGSDTGTLRLKYGSTTLGTLTSGTSSGNGNKVCLEAILMANASTSAQKADFTSRDVAGAVPWTKGATGTATENSATTLNLVITSQLQNSLSAGNNVTLDHFVIEKF